ncbi:GIY-YIG nuclease family protein [Candidatus Saccharibacteria bacterium]|nr:GIY-YIG nuclease family protein [Candidatus Saccharibacteria bacterium]
MFCYVYVLRSKSNGNIYIGFTTNLQKRITEHNTGNNKSTKPYLPWDIIYYEAHRNELDARRREKYLKTTNGRRSISNMLREELIGSGVDARQKVYN